MATKTLRRQLGNFDTNPIEAVRDAGSDVLRGIGRSLKHDLMEESVNDAWNQLLGATRKMTSKDINNPVKEASIKAGDLNEGEELIFPKKEQKVAIKPAIDYVEEIVHSQEKTSQKENQELRVRLDEITIELRKLSKSSKQLEVEFKDVDIEMLPQTPGKYHLNFFEWLLLTIQNARMKIEESANWVQVVSGKKAKKDYWSLAKKHGTSFSLSGERIAATQTG